MDLADLWSWFLANKTWVFSGGGIAVIAAAARWYFGRRSQTESRIDTTQQQGGSRNIQVAGEATIIQEATSTTPASKVDEPNDGGDSPQPSKTKRKDSESKETDEEPLSALESGILFVFAAIAEESGIAGASASEEWIVDQFRERHSVVSIKNALNKLNQRKFLWHHTRGNDTDHHKLISKGTEWLAKNEDLILGSRRT